jgi:site-specific recombinase XerD
VLEAFRLALQTAALEMDGEPRIIATFAERWASTPQRRFKAQVQLSPASIKHTLDIISSFYRYLLRHEVLLRNPIDLVERPHTGEYESATPLDFRFVRDRLKEIPVQTLLGQRDLAILTLAFSTGRRASELAALSIGDISPAGASLRITWLAKGGKQPFNVLEPFAADALRSWLRRWYHAGWETKREAPVWVRIEGDELQQGTRLSYWGIRDVYIRWFGEEASKVHTSRHTFAAMKLKSGASLLELMTALGHESLDVTHRYAKHLAQAIEADPQGAQIAALLGFGDVPDSSV